MSENKAMKRGHLRNRSKATREKKELHREEPDVYSASENAFFTFFFFVASDFSPQHEGSL